MGYLYVDRGSNFLSASIGAKPILYLNPTYSKGADEDRLGRILFPRPIYGIWTTQKGKIHFKKMI